MKPFYVTLLFWLFFFGGCQKIVDPTFVGSSKDTEIANMSFTVDTTYISSSYLYARGKVSNNGTNKALPPWYVEAQFYADSTYVTKLGGNNTLISVPLDPGQQTFWTISFTSSQVDVRQFPKFRVKDIRAIYKN